MIPIRMRFAGMIRRADQIGTGPPGYAITSTSNFTRFAQNSDLGGASRQRLFKILAIDPIVFGEILFAAQVAAHLNNILQVHSNAGEYRRHIGD